MMMIETSSTFLLVGCHSFSLSIKFSSLLLLSSAPQDESDHSSSLVLVLIKECVSVPRLQEHSDCAQMALSRKLLEESSLARPFLQVPS